MGGLDEEVKNQEETKVVDLNEAIRVNEKYVKENSCDSMIERELRVMRMIADTQKI